ncbi:MAG: PQQ-dependent sugar dehydrogenase [Candidatus Promineifilaceae bacterium]|jgi:glucose/arabinose dehydrogenase
MKQKGVLLVVFLLVFSILAIGSAAEPSKLHAKDGNIELNYLPVVTRPFAPRLEKFVANLVPPAVVTDIVDPGDGRLFIVTRDGRIQVSTPDGTLQPDLLLDIVDKVDDDGNEMGLLGLAVHPQFAANGQIFVYYCEEVVSSSKPPVFNAVVARYTVGESLPIDPETEKRILQIELPTTRHHGGAMHFGPQDGYLYIGVGDGGTGRDHAGNGQSKETLLGKILRIDVDNGSPYYAIPPDNPFVSDGKSRGEIWALGLRNPWRFSFDRQTGDMFIGDVGEESWEEINFIPAGSGGGQNFGWSCMEGPDVFRQDACMDNVTYIAPIFTYHHQLHGECAVAGGYMYRGEEVPELAGQFLFGDLCSTKLMSLKQDSQGAWTMRDYGRYGHFVTTFGERHDGELFLGDGNSGNIYQIVGIDQTG